MATVVLFILCSLADPLFDERFFIKLVWLLFREGEAKTSRGLNRHLALPLLRRTAKLAEYRHPQILFIYLYTKPFPLQSCS